MKLVVALNTPRSRRISPAIMSRRPMLRTGSPPQTVALYFSPAPVRAAISCSSRKASTTGPLFASTTEMPCPSAARVSASSRPAGPQVDRRRLEHQVDAGQQALHRNGAAIAGQDPRWSRRRPCERRGRPDRTRRDRPRRPGCRRPGRCGSRCRDRAAARTAFPARIVSRFRSDAAEPHQRCIDHHVSSSFRHGIASAVSRSHPVMASSEGYRRLRPGIAKAGSRRGVGTRPGSGGSLDRFESRRGICRYGRPPSDRRERQASQKSACAIGPPICFARRPLGRAIA